MPAQQVLLGPIFAALSYGRSQSGETVALQRCWLVRAAHRWRQPFSERPPRLSGRCDLTASNKNALGPFSSRPLRFAAGLIFMELILKNFFKPPQPRGPASVAEHDMVLQCALEPYPPARPGHRTHLAHHFRRLHPPDRLSHVDRQPECMIQRLQRNRMLSDIRAFSGPCAHVRGGMRRWFVAHARMYVCMFVRYLSRARDRDERGWRM